MANGHPLPFPGTRPYPRSFGFSILNLQVGVAVVPGQPLDVFWGFESTMLSIREGTAKAAFYVLHPTSGKIQINNPTTLPVSGGFAVDGELLAVSDNPSLIPIDDAVGSSVYDIEASDKNGGLLIELDLELQGIDASGKPVNVSIIQRDGYIVVKDAGVSWNWTPLNQVDWKATYMVEGKLVNAGKFAKVSITSLELSEENSTNATFSRTTQLTSPGEIDPGISVSVVSSSLSQDWRWISTFDYSQTGPLSKQFAYTIDFTFKDQFGNTFPLADDGARLFLFGPLNVTVSVSEEKRNHQVSANNEFWAGALFTAQALALGVGAALAALDPYTAALAAGLAIGAAAASAAAAGFNAAAQGDSAAANDPIQPDFNLRSYAERPTVLLGKGLRSEKKFLQSKRFLEMVLTVRGAEDVVYHTLPRVLGAHIANDGVSFARQLSHCQKALDDIQKGAGQLEKVADTAAREVDAFVLKKEDDLRSGVLYLKAKGVDNETRERLLEAGIPSNWSYTSRILCATKPFQISFLQQTTKNNRFRPLQSGM
jgi:hypothetical protein